MLEDKLMIAVKLEQFTPQEIIEALGEYKAMNQLEQDEINHKC